MEGRVKVSHLVRSLVGSIVWLDFLLPSNCSSSLITMNCDGGEGGYLIVVYSCCFTLKIKYLFIYSFICDTKYNP